jgi:hypothetical protein
MPARDGSRVQATEQASASDAASPPRADQVSAHYPTPDRVVFTEADNSDGWIASDLTVTLRR